MEKVTIKESAVENCWTNIDAIAKADSLFALAADLWVEGNNSGNSDTLAKCEAHSDDLQRRGIAILAPFGITVDFPGLYPTWQYKGKTFYSKEELFKWGNED